MECVYAYMYTVVMDLIR